MERFADENPKMMYDQVMNHFGVQINYRVYDASGDVTDKYAWESWEGIDDKSLKEHIFRDCIM